jgi:uncharacterized repeat protein (TIGR01451 family)
MLLKKQLLLLFTSFTFGALSFAQCPGYSLNETTIDVTCNGGIDGSLFGSPAGGSGNYNFELYEGSGTLVMQSTQPYFNNLLSNNYYLVTQDLGNACFDTTYFIINEPSPVFITGFSADDTCGMCVGTMQVAVTGGTAPYSYNWSNGSTTASQTNVCAGVYTVDIVDANGCYNIYTVNVGSVGAQIGLNTASTQPNCGFCDGTLTTNPSGGSGGYTYDWQVNGNTIGTTQTISNLCPDTYTLTVTDGNGCSTDSIYQLYQQSNVAATYNSTPSHCGICDGTIQVSAFGGTAPYTYDIQQSQNTTGIFTGLCANYYTLLVLDANGCDFFATIQVYNDSISNLGYSANVTDESVTGSNDGNIDVSITSANPNLSYNWSPSNGTTQDIYNLGVGYQTVTISDTTNNQCNIYSEYVNTTNSYGYVTGILYADNNNNCVFDAGDVLLTNSIVTLTDGTNSYTAITNNQGYYSAMVPNGVFVVTPSLPVGYTVNCSPNSTVTISGNTASNVNFSGTAPAFENLCVYTYNFGYVPGFDCYEYLSVTNYGNQTSDGLLTYIVSAPMTYVTSGTAPTSISGDTLTWQISNIPAGQSVYISLTLNCPIGTPLGTTVLDCASVELLGGGTDVNPNCNNYCFPQIVTGSFDPNDKAVAPMGEGSTGDITVDNDVLTYKVRFQNTGTGPAVNIYITDTLDAMLDMSSLQMLGSSHNFNIELLGSNIVRWRFNNINLPDSGSNEPESHGHVIFKIKTSSTPQLGETIENTANIYFDFNEPVITNTTMNTYAEFLSVTEPIEIGELTLYPNPATNIIHVVSENGQNSVIKILDLNGRLVMTERLNNGKVSLDVSNLTNGMYVISTIGVNGIERNVFIKE